MQKSSAEPKPAAALVQQITPDLLQWISAQARAGHPQSAVLEVMRASGWQDEIAQEAIERTKRGTLRQAPVPATVKVPDPDPTDSTHVLKAPDREVSVLSTMKQPRIVVLGGLLSQEECDSLIDLARDRLNRSQTVDNWNGSSELTDARTSHGMCFDRGENEITRRVEKRISALVDWPIEHGEGIQVLRYGVGAEYRPHHDYFDTTVPASEVTLTRGGQRVATLVMYLNTPAKGGSTLFPESRFQVAPIKGNAVFFSYDRAHPVSRTLHGGAPVLEGEKWIATKWLREKPF